MATKDPKTISEIELINLSKKISPLYYRILGNNLGFCQAELDNFVIQSHNDVQEAIHTILRRWNGRRPSSENSREVLADILDDTELTAIGDLLRSGDESLFRGSSKASRPSQRASAAQIMTPTTTRAPTSSSSQPIDSTINTFTGMLAGLLPRGMQLPQHNSHVYNATSSDTVKVVLTTSRNDNITHVLHPKSHCRIPTPYGRVRLKVYRKDDEGVGGFARNECAQFADDSDRSFIVKKSGNNVVIVRSKYGQFRTEES